MATAMITGITESHPLGLQLRMLSGPGDIVVDLTDDCLITHAGQSMNPGELRCGMSVRIADVRERVLSSLEVISRPP